MHQSPPCPTCGQALRWFAEPNAWGCDRCRVMFPPAGPAAVRRRSRAPLWIASGAVLVGVLAAVVVAASQSSDGDDGTAAEPMSKAGANAAGLAGTGAKAADAGPATSRPEAASIGDFWLWPAADGSVRITSPILEVRFPDAPSIGIDRSPTRTADGQPFDIHRFSLDLGDQGLLKVEVMSMGRNMTAVGSVDAVAATMSRVGPVSRTRSDEAGFQVTRLEARQSGIRSRAHLALDLERGLVIAVAAVSDDNSPSASLADRFLESVRLRHPPDPLADPALLSDLRVEPAGDQFAVGDPDGRFTITLPWKPAVQRVPATPKEFIAQAVIEAQKGDSVITVKVLEGASWDALRWTPAKNAELTRDLEKELSQPGVETRVVEDTVAGMPAHHIERAEGAKGGLAVDGWTIANRLQHRLYFVFCVEASCDEVIRSIRFGPTAPVP